ncbi:CTP synthase, partial [Maribellus luteus]
PCKLEEGSKARAAYSSELVYERHRHRYEFSNEYREQFEANGMIFSGTSPDGRLVEIIEIPEHKWFVACQFHPELISRPERPQALFHDFIQASLGE